VRDVARQETGTAVLSGTVMTDEPDTQPVRRAVVIVHMGDMRRQRQTSTDDRGRFTFAGLPAGNATLMAGKPAYVTTYNGARRPGATNGVPIGLTAGEQVNVTIRLPRGGVITGTVFDEDGRPVPSTSVRIHQIVVSPSGERSLVNYSSGALIPSTDDRGMYRVYGLPAGNYAVSVQPRVGGVAGGGDLRQSTAAELQWAERVVQAGRAGASGAPVTGATPPPTPASSPWPPARSDRASICACSSFRPRASKARSPRPTTNPRTAYRFHCCRNPTWRVRTPAGRP
jgi:hypothetical protein